MKRIPPAVTIGPPRLGEPHAARTLAGWPGSSGRVNEPSGTSHKRRPVFRSMATSVPNGGGVHGNPEQAMAEDKRLGRDYEYNGMWGTPYVMRRRILVSPSGLPCTPPPFGTLVAIDLKTGRRLWEVPLGSFTRPLEPGQAAKVRAEWGSPNLGGRSEE